MTKFWVDEEGRSLWGQFQRDPDAVVNVLPRGHHVKYKFPDGIVAAFFNAYGGECLWRDKPKTGLERLNRVMGLAKNGVSRQQALEQRDPKKRGGYCIVPPPLLGGHSSPPPSKMVKRGVQYGLRAQKTVLTAHRLCRTVCRLFLYYFCAL